MNRKIIAIYHWNNFEGHFHFFRKVGGRVITLAKNAKKVCYFFLQNEHMYIEYIMFENTQIFFHVTIFLATTKLQN